MKSINNKKSGSSQLKDFFPELNFFRKSETKYQLQHLFYPNNYWFENSVEKFVKLNGFDKSLLYCFAK